MCVMKTFIPQHILATLDNIWLILLWHKPIEREHLWDTQIIGVLFLYLIVQELPVKKQLSLPMEMY